MEPIPETVEAINELDAFAADVDLLEQLRETGRRVNEVVPECIGMSYTLRDAAVTFTLVASDPEIALLDAVQYVAGGPCIDTVGDGDVRAVDRDVMDEQGWWLLADASAAHGVVSTLSLPQVRGDQVVGGFNLYAASVAAFDGHHQELSEILGAWAEAAVTNADLSFSTRDTARTAPARLREARDLDVATGLLAGRLRCDLDTARERLVASAARAGVDPARLAAMLVEVLRPGVA